MKIILPTLDKAKAEATAELAVQQAGCACDPLIVVDTERQGFTKTVNRGLCEALDGELVGVLVDDAAPVTKDWLKLLTEPFEKSQVGFVGPSGPCRTEPQNRGKPEESLRYILVDRLAFFCVVMRTQMLREVGLLDEGFVHYGSDIDLQRRARQHDWYSLWAKGVYVQHGVGYPIADWWKHDTRLLHERYSGANRLAGR